MAHSYTRCHSLGLFHSPLFVIQARWLCLLNVSLSPSPPLPHPLVRPLKLAQVCSYPKKMIAVHFPSLLLLLVGASTSTFPALSTAAATQVQLCGCDAGSAAAQSWNWGAPEASTEGGMKTTLSMVSLKRDPTKVSRACVVGVLNCTALAAQCARSLLHGAFFPSFSLSL